MAKKQSFGDKVRKQKAEAKRMAQIVVSEKKANGHFRFKTKMVDASVVKDELAAAKNTV